MRKFIYRLLGWECCGEWTQWEIKKSNFSRPVQVSDGSAWLAQLETITFTKRWQERRCTLCGRMQQRDLDQ